MLESEINSYAQIILWQFSYIFLGALLHYWKDFVVHCLMGK